MSRQGPEAKLVEKMRKAAREEYGERYKDIKHHGSEFSATGVSDLIACLDGVFVAAEVKSPESSTHKRKTLADSIAHALEHGPTLKQRLFVASVLKAGGCAGFAATVEQYMEILTHAEERAAEFGIWVHCGGHNV